MWAIAVSFTLGSPDYYVINNRSLQQQKMYAEQRSMQAQQFQM